MTSRRIEIEGHGPVKVQARPLAEIDAATTRPATAELIAGATLRPKLTAEQVASLSDDELARVLAALRSMSWFAERSGA